MSTRSWAVCITIFSNGSIILTGFKFTKLHALTLVAHSYALLRTGIALSQLLHHSYYHLQYECDWKQR